MRFAPPPRRRDGATSIVPMINVVFLLLIFFLMTARIAPAPPFEVRLPEAAAAAAPEATEALYLSTEGILARGAAQGEAAWADLAARPPEGRVALQADGALEAAELARTLARLGALGVTRIELVVAQR